MNSRFWLFVKNIIELRKLDLKPCQYYNKNKCIVNKQYKEKYQNNIIKSDKSQNNKCSTKDNL